MLRSKRSQGRHDGGAESRSGRTLPIGIQYSLLLGHYGTRCCKDGNAIACGYTPIPTHVSAPNGKHSFNPLQAAPQGAI